MRLLLLLVSICFLSQGICQAQDWARWNTKIDSLEKKIQNNPNDTAKAQTILSLGDILINKAWNAANLGQFALAYETYGTAFDLFENPDTERFFRNFGEDHDYHKRYWSVLANINFNFGLLMGVTKNQKESLRYFKKVYEIANKRKDVLHIVYTNSAMALMYLEDNKIDSAIFTIEKAIAFAPELYQYENYTTVLYIYGSVKFNSGQFDTAKSIFLKGVEYSNHEESKLGLTINCLGLSKAYRKLNMPDSSYFYGIQALNLLKEVKEIQPLNVDLASGYENMYQHFQTFEQRDSAFKYLTLASHERTFFSKKTISSLAEFQQVLLQRQLLIKDLEKEKIEMQGRSRMYFFVTALVVFLVVGTILYFGYRQKQKANAVLSSQKEELQSALVILKSTQSQLIQSEKMASLGELTAGIAHEIQNPLNFVNNFSEVNKELAEELEQEVDKGNTTEVKALAKDIKENQEKILHHGKRADAIVKGMLQHSRNSSGAKEPTDINALCDEYLRLSYHGLRAKDKSFNAKFETDFDALLPKVNVVPQDIGRVVLNLINNAFFAVNEKRKTNNVDYEPTVIISTKKLNDKVLISVKDNGPGIPDSIKEKIFQPFFTTKPTGQGTGLGLSLSYDIVKAHGGELKLETNDGEGSTFFVLLPMTKLPV